MLNLSSWSVYDQIKEQKETISYHHFGQINDLQLFLYAFYSPHLRSNGPPL